MPVREFSSTDRVRYSEIKTFFYAAACYREYSGAAAFVLEGGCMEDILKRLSEIEASANRILDRTAEQKTALSEEMKAKTAEFDQQIEEETNKQLADMKESLKRQREEDLTKIRTQAEEQVKKLEAAYAKEHTRLAQELMHRILEG